MKNYSTKVILSASLLIGGLVFAQTKIDQVQAKFAAATPPAFVDGEIPAGAVNGTNLIFTLSSIPNPSSSVHLFWNGLRQNNAAGGDYTVVNNVVTMSAASAPQTGDTLFADYRK